MMWNALAFFDGDLVRYDGKAAVQLHRVAVDDFAIELSCNINCKLAVIVSAHCARFSEREAQTWR